VICPGRSARTILEEPDLLLEHLLLAVLGHEDMGHRDAQFLGRLDAGEPVDRGERERVLGRRLDPHLDAMHRQVEQLAVKRVLEVPLEVGPGLGGVGDLRDRTGQVPAVFRRAARKSLQA
jgi:hypothetical protein